MEFNNPRRNTLLWPMPGMNVGESVLYKVEGWNNGPERGCCTYQANESLEDAQAFRAWLVDEGDHDGRRYDNYDILRLTYRTFCHMEVVEP